MKKEIMSAREAIHRAIEKVGSRGALASILGIQRTSLNYAISVDKVTPPVAVKLNRLVPECKAENLYPEIYSSIMMEAERQSWAL